MYASLFPCYRTCFKAPAGWLRGAINIDSTNNTFIVAYPVYVNNGVVQPWDQSINVTCKIKTGAYKNGSELAAAFGQAVATAVTGNTLYTGGVLQGVSQVFGVGNSDWALQFAQTQQPYAYEYAAFYFPVNNNQSSSLNELYAFSAECLGFLPNKAYFIQANDNSFPPSPANATLVPEFPAKYFQGTTESWAQL